MLDLNELVDAEVVLAFARYAVLVVVKMLLMSPMTAFFRMKRKAFANPEDAASLGKGENAKKFLRTDPDVERVRRNHLNDLENIIPFLFVGLFYSISGVSLSTALLHYRIFLGSRIFHTIAYLDGLFTMHWDLVTSLNDTTTIYGFSSWLVEKNKPHYMVNKPSWGKRP